jgi:hypothetical protein
MDTGDIDFILQIHNSLYDDKFSVTIPSIILNELKCVYTKTVCLANKYFSL